MTKVEALEREVEKLSPEELASFRDWFAEYDWQAWDLQIERDSAEGRLDKLAAEALAEFDRGETREL
jgi:succinate dehydrogenase flavin-adding protein (antitoxin of CptAB toxin-antitoxin module)